MIGEHHQAAEEQHGPEPNQAIDENGNNCFGLLVVCLAGSVIGFHEVATCGTEQE